MDPECKDCIRLNEEGYDCGGRICQIELDGVQSECKEALDNDYEDEFIFFEHSRGCCCEYGYCECGFSEQNWKETMTHKEALAFLKGFMHEVNTQNNRGTARPIFFVIRYRDFDGAEWREDGLFFTDSGAKNHLKANRHRYPAEAHTYVKHIFRAPEMEKLFETLNIIITGN